MQNLLIWQWKFLLLVEWRDFRQFTLSSFCQQRLPKTDWLIVFTIIQIPIIYAQQWLADNFNEICSLFLSEFIILGQKAPERKSFFRQDRINGSCFINCANEENAFFSEVKSKKLYIYNTHYCRRKTWKHVLDFCAIFPTKQGTCGLLPRSIRRHDSSQNQIVLVAVFCYSFFCLTYKVLTFLKLLLVRRLFENTSFSTLLE